MSKPDNPTDGQIQLRSGKLLRPDAETTTSSQNQPSTSSRDTVATTSGCSSETVDQSSSSTQQDEGPKPDPPKQTTTSYFSQRADDDSYTCTYRSTFQYYDRTADMTEGSNSLLPNPFHGSTDEDAFEFLDNYKLWATFRHGNREGKTAALPLLFKDGAAAWYHTQPSDVRQSYDNL